MKQLNKEAIINKMAVLAERIANNPPNIHVLYTEFVYGKTHGFKSVSIKSLRFNQRVTISAYKWPSDLLHDIATAWLTDNGFNILGIGEGKTGFYFFTDTFKPIK